jgi:hypothetical protein
MLIDKSLILITRQVNRRPPFQNQRGAVAWPAMVRCSDCGFLAMRHRESRELLCAERSSEGLPEQTTPVYDPIPVCAAGVVDFRKLLDASKEEGNTSPAHAVYLGERKCSEYIGWVPALITPREHQALKDSQRALEREDARDKAQAEAHKEQVSMIKSQHQEQMEVVKRQHNIELGVFGLFIAAATLAAAVLDGLVSRGVDLWPF